MFKIKTTPGAFKGPLKISDDTKMAYLFLFPSIVLLGVFLFYPILYVFLMAFSETNKVGQLKGFAGFGNFQFIFSDPGFWTVVGRTILWTVLGVVSKTVLGMVIALILNVSFRGQKVARMLFIIPWASSVPISAMVWTWVFHSEFGLLNHTLRLLGMASPPVWLGYPVPAFAACMWVDIWLGLPFMALVFLSGMQSIPSSLYESAEMDGAGPVRRFFAVTLPGLKDVTMVATLLSMLWTFNDFNVIYILTKGGPAGKTDILITSIYKYGFEWLKFSNAAVMAVVTFVLLSAVSIAYSQFYFRKEDAA